jgi:acyl-CoA thioesterase I
MKKVMLLADSCGLPRGFPESEKTAFEETYPYLLRKHFPNVDFFQLCVGGISGPELIGQAVAYFDKWRPDIIIVQVGIDDCRPEPIPNVLRIILSEIEFLQRFKGYIYKPAIMKRLIRFWPFYRISPNTFKRNVKKIQAVFPASKLYWMEIFTSADGGYEEHRPGVLKHIQVFNDLLKNNVKSGYVPLHDELNSVAGVNADHLHLNPRGHRKIFEILTAKLENEFGKQKINE